MTENHTSNSYQPPLSSQPSQHFGNSADAAEVDKPVVPRTVRAAFITICVLGVIYLANQVFSLFALPQSATSVEGIDPEMSGAMSTFTTVFTVIIALVMAATFFVVAFFVKAGHQWARILAIVLSSLSVLSHLVSLIALPLLMSFIDSMSGWSEIDSATRQQLEDSKALMVHPVAIMMTVLSLVLYIFVIVLLSLRPSSRFYREMRERKMAHLRASHQYAYNDASVQNGAPVGYNAGYHDSSAQGYAGYQPSSAPTYGTGYQQGTQDARGYAPAQGGNSVQGNYGYSAPGASPFGGQAGAQNTAQPSSQGSSRVADAANQRPTQPYGEREQGGSQNSNDSWSNEKSAE